MAHDKALVLFEVHADCRVWLLSVVPWFHAFQVWNSGIVRMIFRWFKVPLLLLVWLLFLHYYYYYYYYYYLCSCRAFWLI